MRFFTARRLAAAALASALLTLSLIPGCSNQGEGERCGSDIEPSVDDNADCGDGLVCTSSKRLLDKTASRCCYANGRVTNSRCTGSDSASSGGASNGGANNGGANNAGSGGASAGSSAAGDTSAAGSSTEAGAAGSN